MTKSERCGAKLKVAQVLAIRKEYAAGQFAVVTKASLAKKYGVSVLTIRNIVTRKGWKWLPPEGADHGR